jgi:signal transduction histidine kinase
MLTSSEILERYHGRMPIENQLTHILRIQEQIHDMNSMIEDVLTLDKAQSGKLPFEPVPADLELLCRRIFERMKFSAPSNLHLGIETMGSFEGAQVDSKLLEHILINLLSNAIKYSPRGGEITFELERSGGDAVIRISDQGIGIPEADMSRLFEPFHRADNVGSIGGTGLGLSIVKNYAELHNGTINAESEENVGNVFTLRLPLFTEQTVQQT